MPSYHHQWLYLKGVDDLTRELFNGARTFAYLSNPDLSLDGVSISNVLDFAGCEAYAYEPPCSDSQNGYLEGNGVAGNFMTIPDAASLEISGDATIVVEVSQDDWTPLSAARALVSKWTTSGNARSWSFEMTTAGALSFLYSTAGTATSGTLTSSANLGALANGTKRWVAATIDANDGSGNGSVRFWWSLDGVNWNELGVPQAATGVISMFNSSAVVRIGGMDAATASIDGKIHFVSVRSGIGDSNTIGGIERLRFDGDNDIHNTTDLVIQLAYGHTGTRVTGVSGGTFLSVLQDTTEWDALSFSTPEIDEAPWWNPNYPESGDALGFFIEEWTGLDGGHVRRPTTPRGSPGTGAQMGRLSADGRVQKFNVLLFARSEEAMEYLYRWLETTLHSVCSSCATDSILVRRKCPDHTLDLWDGVVEMREVGLVEGLVWESDPVSRGRCMLRRLSFSIAAGDPCLYLGGTEVATLAEDLLEVIPPGSTHDRSPCRPACGEVTLVTVASINVNTLGAAAPYVEVFSPSEHGLSTVATHVMAMYDPGGIGVGCGLEILGEIWVRSLPGNTRFAWDVVGRRVWYMDPSTGGWAPGEHLVHANTPGIPRWFVLPCGQVHIVAEVGTLCLEEMETGYLDHHGEGGFYFPGFVVSYGERLGCP